MTTVATIQEEEYNKRFSLETWKTLSRHARPYLRNFVGLVISAVVLAACEGLFTMLLKYTIDVARSGRPAEALLPLAAAYVGVSLGFALSVMVFIRQAGRISTGIAYDIRSKAFGHLQDLSFSFYDRRPAGWLVARLTSDCDRISRTIAWGSLDMIWGSCMVIGLSVIMLVFDWKLGLLVLTIMPPLVLVSAFFQKRILTASRAVRKHNSTITAGYSECIMGVRTTKVLVREGQNLREFEDKTGKMYEHSVINAILTSAYLPIVLVLGSIGSGIALWIGGSRAAVAGASAEIGTLILFISCAGMMIWPILEMARVFSELQGTQAAAERVFGLIETEPDVRDTPEALAALARYRNLAPVEGTAPDGHDERIENIEFRNVGFEYVEGQTVLEDFSLTVRAGQTVALVGPTGGGKTTVVSLLCRFYEPTAGEILINGVEYRKRSLAWLQGSLGIVLQQPHLFNDTVAENIRYGRLDATDDEVADAAGKVHAHDFISKMDDAYQTSVGEGGSSLSTGQKQLVSFARAVLADPQIFVMDEATSSVDTETERLIQDGLAGVLAGRISFIIAHRLSTIRSSDMIVVIDGGRIVEQGTHASLIADRGRYYKLYTNQFAEERTSELLAPPCPEQSEVGREAGRTPGSNERERDK
jgi:ATP-binding cassette subfamily B protein